MSDEIEFFPNDESDWVEEDTFEDAAPGDFEAKYSAPAGMSGPWNNNFNSETPSPEIKVSPKTGAIIAPPSEFESVTEPAQPVENAPEAALTKLEQWNIDTEQLVREIEDAEDKLEDGQESARRQLYDWETKAKRNIRNMKRKLADLRAAKPKGK